MSPSDVKLLIFVVVICLPFVVVICLPLLVARYVATVPPCLTAPLCPEMMPVFAAMEWTLNAAIFAGTLLLRALKTAVWNALDALHVSSQCEELIWWATVMFPTH